MGSPDRAWARARVHPQIRHRSRGRPGPSSRPRPSPSCPGAGASSSDGCDPALGPAQKDVAGGLHHPLPIHHPLAVLGVAAVGQQALQDRPSRLLDLQEQQVLLIATLQQDDVGSGADAAHPDHLAGHIDQLEPLQQLAPIILQGSPVGTELRTDVALSLVGDRP